jgi:hypothetical protein
VAPTNGPLRARAAIKDDPGMVRSMSRSRLSTAGHQPMAASASGMAWPPRGLGGGVWATLHVRSFQNKTSHRKEENRGTSGRSLACCLFRGVDRLRLGQQQSRSSRSSVSLTSPHSRCPRCFCREQ